MQVTIFEAEITIGEAQIFALDPPMGVAMAKFQPSPAYDVERHANVIDGDYVADRGGILRIEMSDGVALKSNAISIQDYPALDEIELHILGIYEPNFDKLFAEHPDFKANWNAPKIPKRTIHFERLSIGFMPITTVGWAYLFVFIAATIAGVFLAQSIWAKAGWPGASVVQTAILLVGALAMVRFAYKRS